MSLIRRTLVLAVGTVAVSFALSAFAAPLYAKGASPKPPPAAKPPQEPKAKDIVDTLMASTDPTFKSFLDALKAADLTATLKGTGPFTLFAPSDDAFKKLPEGKLAEWMKPESKSVLKAILLDHVVASKMLAADLAKVKTVKTTGGRALEVQIGDDKAWVGIQEAKVKKTDVVAGNGVIHFMDAVIMPKDGGAAATASTGSGPVPAYTAAELSNLKALAGATLESLNGGAAAAMAAKLTDLETAWDDKEAALKPKDPATWTLLDKTLDRAISALRSGRADLAKGKAALEDLIKRLDQATKP